MDWLLRIILVIAGAIAGIVAAYVWLDRRHRNQLQSLQTARALAEQKELALTQELAKSQEQAQSREKLLQQETEKQRTLTDSARREAAAAEATSAAFAAQLEASEKNISEQKTLLDDANT